MKLKKLYTQIHSLPSIPEPGPEIIRTREEGCVSWRMNHPPDRSIMSQRQQLFSAGIPTVPAAEGGGGLVRKHNVILCLVKHGLCLILLLPGSASSSVGNQTST